MTLATLRHVGIVVSDLTACQQFWENVFDFTVYAVADESSEFIGKLLHQPAPIKCKTIKLIGPSNVLIEFFTFLRIRLLNPGTEAALVRELLILPSLLKILIPILLVSN